MASFTSAGDKTGTFCLRAGESITSTIAGTFTGKVELQCTEFGETGPWEVKQEFTEASSATLENMGRPRWYRLYCVAVGAEETITATYTTSIINEVAYTFNDLQGQTRLVVDGTGIVVTGAVTGNLTGNVTGNVTGSISGSASQVTGGLQAVTASGAIASTTNVATLSKTGGGIAATIAAPAAGRRLVITQTGAETEGHTVTLTAGTFDGTNTIANFNAAGETLDLIGLSATRFLILNNIGAVGLS